MSKVNHRQTLNNLAEYMQIHGDEPLYAWRGEIVGASFYDDEKGETRPTPRVYIDMEQNISVGHHRVYVIEVIEVNAKKGNEK